MKNTSIIFFGKPDGFESYEFKSQGIRNEIDYFEPKLKLESHHQNIFHTYFKNGFFYIEFYGFARAYYSGRDGIVIGVAIKSDKEFNISSGNYDILKELLDKFKAEGLNGNMFKCPNILDIIKSFKLQDKIFDDFDYTNNARNSTTGGILLFYLENYENNLHYISEFRKKYSDIYVSEDLGIYKTKLNAKFLYETNNKFFTISNSQLIEYKEPTKVDAEKTKSEQSTENDAYEPKSAILKERKKLADAQNEFQTLKKNSFKKIRALTILSFFLCLSLIVFFLKDFYVNNKTNVEPTGVSENEIRGLGKGSPNKLQQKENPINIDSILVNSDNRNILNNVLDNIEIYEQTSALKNYNAIIRDCRTLNIDHSIFVKLHDNLNNSQTVKISSGMTIRQLLKEFNDQYTIEEIWECNKEGVSKEYTLNKSKNITMPCKSEN